MKTAIRRTIAPAEGQRLLKSLMANVSEAVLIIEPHAGGIVEVNQQAARELGYSIDES